MLKALVILLLSVVIFGGAAYFGYDIFIKPKKLAEQAQIEPERPAPPDPTIPQFEEAMKLKTARKPVEARTALYAFIENYPYSTKIPEAEQALGEINAELFFSSVPTPDKEAYVIKSGDALAKIERRFKTTGELIMRTNNISSPTKLRIGDTLYIPKPEFSLLINRKEKTVTLLNKGLFFKKYRVKTWNIPAAKKTQPINAKITERIAWKEGERVASLAPEAVGAPRWIMTTATHYTIYTEPEEGAPAVQKPPAGISLDRSEAEELAILVSRNTPVLIQ